MTERDVCGLKGHANCEIKDNRLTHHPAGAIIRAKVTLFKPSGKYYTEEEWAIPSDAKGPHDMANSPDFRRIDGGVVLVDAQEPWGYPFLIWW
jgi:hypothetical protein